MANTQAFMGLQPYAPGGGSVPPNYVQSPVQIAFNYSTKIFKYDPVIEVAAGFIQAWTAGSDVAQFAGVFLGCEYLSNISGWGFRPFWPAAGDVASSSIVRAYIYRCDAATPMWFLAQSDLTTGLTQANVYNNIDVGMGTGNTTTGMSGAFLNSATINTTNTLPFRIMRLYSEGSGTALGSGGLDNGSIIGPGVKAYVSPNFARIAGV